MKANILKIGIISGAGPMAGIVLMQRIIDAMQKMGCHHDTDFPEIILHSVPFSDMLSAHFEVDHVKNDLQRSIDFLERYTDIIYIACQTLHQFLGGKNKVRSLLDLLQKKLDSKKRYAVIASSTSVKLNLHTSRFNEINCYYHEPICAQAAIDSVLKGKNPDFNFLSKLDADGLILGCTEFSVIKEEINLNICNRRIEIIDPFDEVISEILGYLN